MQIIVDMDDYVSILAYVRMLGRKLAPVLEGDLPALLGRRAPSGLRRVVDAAARGRLHTGFARDMLPVIADACDRAIEDGVSVEGDWIEVGWSDGGVDRAWREWEVLSETARAIAPIRREIRTIIELLERIDDLGRRAARHGGTASLISAALSGPRQRCLRSTPTVAAPQDTTWCFAPTQRADSRVLGQETGQGAWRRPEQRPTSL